MPVYLGKQKMSVRSGIGVQLNGQTKIIIPNNQEQVIVPDNGYNCLTKVTVRAIPYRTENNTYGTTVIIG